MISWSSIEPGKVTQTVRSLHHFVILHTRSGYFCAPKRHQALNERWKEATSLQWTPHANWYMLNTPLIPSNKAPKMAPSRSFVFHDHLYACFLHLG